MSRAFQAVRAAFHEPSTTIYRRVTLTVWVLIVISVGLVALDGVLADGHPATPLLQALDHALLLVFAVEYVLRVASFVPGDLRVFDRPPLGRLRVHLLGRLRYMIRPLMLVDLLTIAALVPGLRGLRALRLLRLLRTVRVFRYGNPFRGLFHAFERDRMLFALAFGFLGLQVGLGGISLYLIERRYQPTIEAPADAMWLALVTITTVGFGDITPATGLGRIVTGVLMVGGMFTLATFAGIVGHSLLNAVLSIREEQFRMGSHVDHIVVCGYEDGMDLLIDALIAECDPEQRQIVVFADRERPPSLPPELYWVSGDPTKESELDKVRIDRAAAAIVAGARHVSPQQADAVTLLTLFTIRSHLARKRLTSKRHEPLYVVAEILDSENVEHARAAGADEVIETRKLGFSLLAHAIEHHGTGDTLSKVALRGEQTLYVGRLPEAMRARTYGDMLRELALRQQGGLVIGVTDGTHDGDRVNPPDDLPVAPGTAVLYLARARLLERP